MKNNKQKVWDIPVRLLHWILVVTVAGAWFTSSRIGPLHEYLGYGTCAIVFVRVVWGFAGNRYARFSQFIHPIAPTLKYFNDIVDGRARRYLGHNPLGAWMIVALLACIAALGVTGWLYTTDLFWGYAWLAQLHAGLGWALLTLIGLHVGGVLFSSWEHSENLVGAMFSGQKDEARQDDVT